MPQDTRTRHMVDISDYAWEKLERLAARIDAATYLYKGRPRYGKLIELAIERLEDSTMEWSEEEVWVDGDKYDVVEELEGVLDSSIPLYAYKLTTSDSSAGYTLTQTEQDMGMYGNAYFGMDYAPGHETTVSLKPIKAKDVKFKSFTSPFTQQNPDTAWVTWEIKNAKTDTDGTKKADLFLYVAPTSWTAANVTLSNPDDLHSIIIDSIADYLGLYTAASVKKFVKYISNYKDTKGRTVFIVELDNLDKEISYPSLAMCPVKAIEKYVANYKKLENLKFKVSAVDTAGDELAKLSDKLKKLEDQDAAKAVGKQMSDVLLDGITNAIVGKKPNPANIHEADVWTYPSNGNFTSVGTTLKLSARTNKEWTEKQLEAVQDAVSYAISGAGWFTTPFHVSYMTGSGNFFEYSSVIEIVHGDAMDSVIKKAKSSLRQSLIELGLSGTKQPQKQTVKSPDKPEVTKSYVKVFSNKPGYIEFTATLSQALSAKQQKELKKFAETMLSEYSSGTGYGAFLVTMKNVPWDKLWISVTYSDPSELLKSLDDIAAGACNKIEAWLLNGNFVGPIPKAE